jgi:hypothetical protein
MDGGCDYTRRCILAIFITFGVHLMREIFMHACSFIKKCNLINVSMWGCLMREILTHACKFMKRCKAHLLWALYFVCGAQLGEVPSCMWCMFRERFPHGNHSYFSKLKLCMDNYSKI